MRHLTEPATVTPVAGLVDLNADAARLGDQRAVSGVAEVAADGVSLVVRGVNGDRPDREIAGICVLADRATRQFLELGEVGRDHAIAALFGHRRNGKAGLDALRSPAGHRPAFARVPRSLARAVAEIDARGPR